MNFATRLQRSYQFVLEAVHVGIHRNERLQNTKSLCAVEEVNKLIDGETVEHLDVLFPGRRDRLIAAPILYCQHLQRLAGQTFDDWITLDPADGRNPRGVLLVRSMILRREMREEWREICVLVAIRDYDHIPTIGALRFYLYLFPAEC